MRLRGSVSKEPKRTIFFERGAASENGAWRGGGGSCGFTRGGRFRLRQSGHGRPPNRGTSTLSAGGRVAAGSGGFLLARTAPCRPRRGLAVSPNLGVQLPEAHPVSGIRAEVEQVRGVWACRGPAPVAGCPGPSPQAPLASAAPPPAQLPSFLHFFFSSTQKNLFPSPSYPPNCWKLR